MISCEPMKIVYISHLKGAIATGLSWSVPASVKAQNQIDDVLWLNTTDAELPHWKEIQAFTKSSRLKNLERIKAPFNHPDLVVFEGFYDDVYDVILGRWLRKNGIPYIIIPRSALTIQAMNNHAKLKKKIAHWLFFNRFIKGACAIQYLTRKECDDTTLLYNNDCFIIPNGIYQPNEIKSSFHHNSIKGIFIGRIDIHQKGLDVMLEAIEENKDILFKNKFSLDVYGPEKQDYARVERMIYDKGLNDLVFLKGETKGENKKKALLESDVFFLTSRFEGHPMGLIEALAYGLPCFVTPGTNMADEIFDAKCGWVADFTKESMSKKLKQMIEEQSLLSVFGENARSLSKEYEWNKLADMFHSRITSIIKY